jgi:hypothetical protein
VGETALLHSAYTREDLQRRFPASTALLHGGCQATPWSCGEGVRMGLTVTFSFPLGKQTDMRTTRMSFLVLLCLRLVISSFGGEGYRMRCLFYSTLFMISSPSLFASYVVWLNLHRRCWTAALTDGRR